MKPVSKFSFALSALLLSFNPLFSQKEGYVWYFGDNAGLDFATSPPTILTNGALSATEGCASISDAAGSLIFYTDGITVYNKAHSIMTGGTGLMGDDSSTQSGIIVKQPGNTNIYYIFTQAATAAPNGFRYSIVDMSLSGGMGAVTVLNTLLYTPSCEKITAVRHCNGIDAWIISHDYNSDAFRAYLLTSTGVSSTPVLSNIGSLISGNINLTLGQMKIAPNGRKLGVAIWDPTNIPVSAYEIFDFDPATGIVSNSLSLLTTNNAYGCEFSADGTKFYGGTFAGSKLFQWDLCAGSNTAIVASQTLLSPTTPTATAPPLGSFQLAPDGKIYIARYSASDLAVINNPNAAGTACGFVELGQSVSPKLNWIGLPNIINSYFKAPTLPFTYTLSCSSGTFTAPPAVSSTITGCTQITGSVSGYAWNFGDPASLSANTSTVVNPNHSFSAPGTYTVKLKMTGLCITDSVEIPVTVLSSAPVLTVAGTFTVCKGEKRTYTVTGASSYTWGTNISTPTISITHTATGIYTVSGTGTNTCKSTKIFTVTMKVCTGLEEEYLQSLAVFPNPFNAMLTLSVPKAVQLTVFNSTGTVVMRRELSAGEIQLDMEGFSSGIYTLSFNYDKTKRVRVVKE